MYFLRMRSLSETESEIGRSKMNRDEADMILAFIAHILHEGYEQSDITVLASYNGQVSFLRRQLRDRQLAGVVCSSIDRYQGDENRFVLVSLVRSNDADEIGFLREPNRLIVAASRARCGVYFFGNDLLLAKKSRDWRQLIRVMKEREEVGDKLPVICPRHPHIPLDLGRECHHVCKAILPCGHTCEAHCHRDGAHPPCKQPAVATLRCGHDKACECSARDQADEILKCHEVVNFHHERCDCDLALDDCKPCAQELEDTKREQMAKIQKLMAQIGDPGFFHVEELSQEQQPLDFDTLTSSVASFFSTSGLEAEIQLAQRVKNADLERQFYRGHELVTVNKPPASFDSAFNSDTACLRLFRLSVGLPKYILQVRLREVAGARPPHWSGAECPAHSERFWKLSLASESEQQALGKALAPGSSLGGRDMHVRGEHSGFRIKMAWRLEHDVLWKQYVAAKTKVQVQMESLRKQGACFAEVRLRTEYSALLRELPVNKTEAMDKQINEVYLSHGTKPEVLLTILQNGLNERFSGGLFGNGTYFAEDVGKNDQYCTPDDGGQHQLQKVLYHELKIRPPPAHSVFYVLFCRVILGSPVRTQDGKRDMDQRPPASVWSSEKRELAAIPKSSPPINFHSLLAERGEMIVRYRELIVYHGTHIYPEYVVAYQCV
ncbi:NFX1-type zinc finger-containing protein 1 [Symbiodinium microadriaticum]|uniref:NFX1-type zinc finger-containing protein 1 n=1 Tax=Symbiodinium microadriaticum TaxID=2951 RepID=A0A1Q9CKI5_SYMMI|nr:NFX1-type zinc finger-containing protein 1 [Symbiodinium microadriaticum]CAE7175802.1 Znfx1 [Symbiodinium microadriaticum]